MARNPGDRTGDPPADQREREGERSEPSDRASGGTASRTAEPEETRAERAERTRGTEPPATEGLSAGDRIAGWFTETAVRGGIALLGVALVLLSIGQIVGIELLGTLVDFLTSSLGAWLIVGLLGLMLILAASRSWNLTSQMK